MKNLLFLFCPVRSATSGREEKKTSPAQKCAILCDIWYHFYNSKSEKTLQPAALLKVTFLPECFLFLKMYKWHQTTQSASYFVKLGGFDIILGKTFTQWYLSSGESPMQSKFLVASLIVYITLTFII